MAIRISSGPNTRHQILPPSNVGIPDVAKNRMSHLVSAANERHHRSLQVDPVYLQIFYTARSGYHCTCFGSTLQLPSAPEELVDKSPEITIGAQNDAELQMSVNSTSSPESDGSGAGGGFSVRRIRGVPKIYVKRRYDRAKFVPHEYEEINEKISDNIINNTSDPTSLGPSVEEQTEDIMKQLLPDNGLYKFTSEVPPSSGGDQTVCGVCLGTGYVNGYQLYNGQRIILESSGETNFNLVNASLDNSKFPHVFTINPQGYVQWDYDFPVYFMNTLNIHARNNVTPVDLSLVSLEYVDIGNGAQNSIYYPLNISNLNDRKNLPNLLGIRLRNISNQSVDFTHIEIYIQTAPWPLGQLPNLQINENFEHQDILITSNIEVEAVIPYIDRGYLIGESKNGFLWRVSDYTSSMTSFRQVYNHQCGVRLIQWYETTYLLNLYRRQMVNLNSEGLQRLEGQGVSDYRLASNTNQNDDNLTSPLQKGPPHFPGKDQP